MENFWSVIWIMLWCLCFVAYLIILFHILSDLFGDDELSGWWKVVWIILLIFVPFLTALVYVIARGRGMTERQVGAARQARSQTDAYIRNVVSASSVGSSPAQDIAQAKKLLDDGTITPAEYAQLKAKALA
jgi:hypothetical protein